MQPAFVKKFDFRGVYNKDIFDKDAYFIGLALTKVYPLKKVLLGWDTRVSSKNLAMQCIAALETAGIEIFYLDVCAIDYVTTAANVGDFDLSIMFTGSHHPWDWTGMLMHTRGGESIQGEAVLQIIAQYADIAVAPFEEKVVDLSIHTNFLPEIEKIYAEKIKTLIPLETIRSQKIVVDIGDGSGFRSLVLLEALLPQVTFVKINNRKLYDQDSSHTADPSEIDHMQDLITEVKKGGYTCGFAFDSDADRVLAVDETGAYINGSIFGSVIAQTFDVLGLSIKTTGYAVDCGSSLYNTVKQLQMQEQKDMAIIPVPVGRSVLRHMLFEGKTDIAIENVGHFYLKDFFMTDSGVFALAVMLSWQSHHTKMSDVFALYPDGYRGQKFFPKSDKTSQTKAMLLSNLSMHFQGKQIKILAVDGTRYEIFEGDILTSWVAMRSSGYEPIEKYYYGSLNKEAFTYLEETITSLTSE